MSKTIDVIELFSGIGGFTLGLKRAGFNIKNHYYSEIDKHAIANYKYNFKDAEYIGSVTDVRGTRGQADIITFGSPCQDFSLAGKRKGMEGQRSSLIMEAIRLVSEIQPSVFIWENVKGTFSSNDGADFWAILHAFTNIGNYRLEWQLLNTSWFLPQNRERIYLVGHLAGRSTRQVFPITETNRVCNKRNKAEKKIYSDNNSIALPQMARQYSNWCGDFIKVWPIKEVRTEEAKLQRKKTGSNSFRDKKLIAVEGNITNTILGSPTKDNSIFIDKKIRQLTEIECERLQGFPDDWTKYGNYSGEVKEISKTQRYKMLGNAVTVDVVAAVTKKLTLL
jgi:DNA (cytosine-5)-methyltransferase 1